MESRYELLVRVAYKHAFFFNRKFDRISTGPTADTQLVLMSNGLLFREDADGFRLLFDTLWAGGVREKNDVVQEGLPLLFQLTLNDPDFYFYTDLGEGVLTRAYFYLSNVSPAGEERPGSESSGVLHKGDFITDDDRVVFGKLPRHFSGRPFGWLQLVLNPKLKDSYEARWPVRSVYWNYIVVSKHLQELNKPAILDPVTKQVFAGPTPILLPDNRKALSFVSETPISFLAAENQLFQLVENFEEDSGKYKVVVSALPRADPGILSDVRTPASRGRGRGLAGDAEAAGPVGAESQAGDGTKKTTAYFSEIFIY
ncbi:MAG TPA: hypothetical protein VL832_05595 [Puia sp.]|jgi:hypothetical protein|nr:hypothetical protein [Puia sp.]